LNYWEKVLAGEIKVIVYQYKKGFVKDRDGKQVFKSDFYTVEQIQNAVTAALQIP